ncbi:flagellar hook assembly protein FlgD [Buchnera aphidicola]|uniref:flagellar hook assembly protein FlgD n=1 Tax=Buchnera aphidicola TaxID=9 RepID=UPI000189C6C4|nr:flagellar hook assembly protein FlgD [Buchnera aphidicola]ACL30142.1 basal-body rod modification protein FlgD [Buchnera aphidicola str. Tuc7 (Acyrthosiphon pisum)]ADP66159.1 basal-body rod modification protein FlgD [Buchnera aphidicola str. LL01 (Acyrthosiphon pisum)]ADP66729.1 basal-body rod modification protein FlgD [Buchnera aphidicola str. TLW03 (Acyrthosiphon pisum)]ADP67314.1 basal-body rod modification protein FlgD [Buchnera aphidicola str. JF99 (Acyrthosiphon pisum)]
MSTININSSDINLPNIQPPIINNEAVKKNDNNLPNDINPPDLQKNFLSLLIAQIKNQDPTDPIKNSDLTSQLAQINTASGMQKLNNTVDQFSNQISKNQNIQLSTLIGRHVMVPNKKIIHTKDTKTQFGIELFEKATSVEIKITDDNNKTLYLKQLKETEAGRHNFFWDGQDLNKNSVMSGQYNISVIAKKNNQNVPVNSLSVGVVNSIIMSSGNAIIDLGESGQITPLSIREILK